jgi:hypothetical protein
LVRLNTPEVNYVTAISNNRFWILLLNEAAQALPVQLTLNQEIGTVTAASGTLYAGSTAIPAVIKRKGNTVTVTTGAKGFTALSFPLLTKTVEHPLPPVVEGMKTIEMGAPWGKLNCFRIRSPFGWDAIYGYLETAPLPAGTTATVTMNGNTQIIQAYPFEWSFYKIEATKMATMNIILKTSSGVVKEEKVEMAGIQ